MSENHKALCLFILVATIVPGIPMFALLALARLPWPVVIGGTCAAVYTALVALACAWVGDDDD